MIAKQEFGLKSVQACLFISDCTTEQKLKVYIVIINSFFLIAFMVVVIRASTALDL